MWLTRIPALLLLFVFRTKAFGQLSVEPERHLVPIKGLVIDPDGNRIPGAVVAVAGFKSPSRVRVTTDASGQFAVEGLDTADIYRLTVTSPGFADWASSEIVLSSGQNYEPKNIALKISAVETTVSAVSVDQIALEQVEREDTQRVLGIIPSYSNRAAGLFFANFGILMGERVANTIAQEILSRRFTTRSRGN